MRCIETLKTNYLMTVWNCDKLQHEMYWNNISRSKKAHNAADKLQHEMYWNSGAYIGSSKSSHDKLQHEMYWNYDELRNALRDE